VYNSTQQYRCSFTFWPYIAGGEFLPQNELTWLSTPGEMITHAEADLIMIAPLRERPEDIPPLVWAFIRQFEKRMGKHIRSEPKQSLETIERARSALLNE
jgi:hypothetical protein